jgi:hypothetical protein
MDQKLKVLSIWNCTWLQMWLQDESFTQKLLKLLETLSIQLLVKAPKM